MKNKYNYNKKGERHGLWKMYYQDGTLDFKGTYINGKPSGLWQWYKNDGKIYHREYHIL